MIFIVKLRATRRDGAQLRIPFETAAYDTKDDLDQALDEGATIAGSKIIFDKGRRDGPSIITSRKDFTITRDDVISTAMPQGEFVDAPKPATAA